MKKLPCLSDEPLSRLKDKEALLGHVLKEFDDSEKSLSDWKTHIITYYELYGLVQRKKHYQGLASIFVPEILRAVETVTANIYDMIFGAPDWMRYSDRPEGRGGNLPDEGPSIALTQLTYFQMDENNFKSRVMDSIRQMVLAGLTVRKVLWDFEIAKKIKPKKNADGSRGKELTYETVRDTWTFEPVDLLSFQISDINIPYNQVQKAKWIGERYLVTRSWINDRISKGWFSDKYIDELNKLEGDPPASRSQDEKDRRSQSENFTVADKKGKIEIIERWGLFPVEWVLSAEEMQAEEYEEGDYCECVFVLANRSVILKLEINPFWHRQKPYLICPYVPKEYQIPGMGAAQIGESLQEEINDTRNQTLDNKTMVLATMWLKSRTSGIRNDDLTMRPNGVITTNDMQGLMPLRPPIVTSVGNNMEGIAKDDLRQSVGAAANLQGIAQSGVDTATESTAINTASVGRLKLAAQLYSELVLRPLFLMTEYLNYQFYDHVKVIAIVGPVGVKYRQLSPEEIQGGNKNVIVRLSNDMTENVAVQRQQLMTMFTAVQEMQPQQLAFHWKMLDKIYEMFFEGHSLSEIYPNPTPDPADLLSPQDERDCCIAEQPVAAQPGQDHKKYIDYLTKELNQMKMALNPIQFELFTKLIMSHHDMLMQEVQAQHMQLLEAQRQANLQQAGSGNQPNPGNIVNKGSTTNTTPYNATQAPSGASIRRSIGG